MVTIRLAPYLCAGGNEVAHLARVTTYGAAEFFDGGCDCPALEEDVFVSVSVDPAPWYSADHTESVDFLGFLPESITLSEAGLRGVSSLGDIGSYVGSEQLPGRVVDVSGWMVARDVTAMMWGQHWLTEALRNPCEDCAGDVLQVLKSCRDDDYPMFDYSQDFRTLVGAKVVQFPRYSELSDSPDFVVQTVQFQIVASMPWLNRPPVNCYTDEPITGSGDPLACLLTTEEWAGGTFVIDITNVDSSATTDILITGRLSLDGSCPVDIPGSSVPPSFVYSIPNLDPEDRLVIDGTRRRVTLYDASDRFASGGLHLFDFEGPWKFPDVGVCASMCLTVEAAGGDATATIDGYLRELD